MCYTPTIFVQGRKKKYPKTKMYKCTVKSNNCKYDYLLWYATVYEQLWLTVYVYIYFVYFTM